MKITCRAKASRLRASRPRDAVTRLGELFWELDGQPLWSLRTRTEGWPGGDLEVEYLGARPALYLEDRINKRKAVYLRTPGSFEQEKMEASLSSHVDPLAATLLASELWRPLWLAGAQLVRISTILMEDRNTEDFAEALAQLAKKSQDEVTLHG